MVRRLRAIVTGDVQGVGFRAFVARHAIQAGLSGFARNLRDGSVEVQAVGEEHSLDELLHHLRTGPPLASVRDVQWQLDDAPSPYQGFRIL